MTRTPWLALGLLFTAIASSSRAEPRSEDTALLQKVSQKLVAVCEAPVGFEWPPDFQIVDNPSINAYATFERREDKNYPMVRVFSGIMTLVVNGNEDALALIVGHEIGHIVKRHVVFNPSRDRTEFLRVTYCRDEEIEADVTGAELMLKAGYDLKKGVKYIERMNSLGLGYSSVEGLGSDHPSWNDRLRRIDKSQDRLYKSMSAFQNGVALLTVEQYALAEDCFDAVTKEFPQCYEGWVNLGNARLMRYFDNFDAEDIKAFGLGQVLTPGFYMRPGSLTTRKVDKTLWEKAVQALNRAVEIKKDSTLARANLGLAYLFTPDVEEKDIPRAISLMSGAADDAIADDAIDPVHRGNILLNLGVAYFGAGQEEKGFSYVDRGVEVGRRSRIDGSSVIDRNLDAARTYTVALVLSRRKTEKDLKIAQSMLQRYLKIANSSSVWWEAAYDQYKTLCKKLKLTPDPKEAFKPDVEPLRPVLSHTLKSGAEVKLTDDFEAVAKRLGAGLERSVVFGTKLKRVRYPKEGIELLANDSVVAICAVSADAAPISLRGKGIGSGVALDMKVGMPIAEVEKFLGEGEKLAFTDPGIAYTYYRSQGIGIRKRADQVAEIVLATIPVRQR